jgi:hypothetical protein
MKAFPNSILHRTLIPIIIAAMSASLSSCWDDPTNIYQDNLTLQEAQALVSFPICLPEYIPPGVDPDPDIIHQAEGPEIIPEENYIRLLFKRYDTHEKVFEVFQRYTNDEELKLQPSEMINEHTREQSKVDLLDWMTDFLSETKIRSALEQMRMDVDVIQTDHVVWRLFEIVYPAQYRSTKTYWVRNHVEYRALSYLPSQEIKAITQSMLNCPNP